MSDVEQQKLNAAITALRFVKPRQILGLGGGSTVRKFIEVLAKKKAKNICLVADNKNTQYALHHGLNIKYISSLKKVNLAVDGADGVDRKFNLIKGAGGGAIAHEKMLDTNADKTIIIVDSTKIKKDLLKIEIPIEVHMDAVSYVTSELKKLGASAKLKKTNGKTFKTDHKNYILNAKFRKRHDPAKLEKIIKSIPGVIEVGIFTNVADYVIVGNDKGAKVLR